VSPVSNNSCVFDIMPKNLQSTPVKKIWSCGLLGLKFSFCYWKEEEWKRSMSYTTKINLLLCTSHDAESNKSYKIKVLCLIL